MNAIENIDENLKKQIWARGLTVDGYPEDKVRKDACGALIVYDDFEKNDSLFGWGVDCIVPILILQNKGVADSSIYDIRNLRPFNIANILSKGDSYPYYTASRIADGPTNVDVVSNKVVNAKQQKELKKLYNL